MLNSVKYVAAAGVDGVKLHATYIMRGTLLEKLYKDGSYAPLTRDKYIDLAAAAITLLPPNVVIHRLVSSCRTELLVAPLWVSDKPGSLIALEESFESGSIFQGMNCDFVSISKHD
jgi:radical SAM superfamily enzyme